MLNVPEGLGMIAFAESLGYKYIGDCACSPRKKIYANPDNKKFQIWISPMQDIFHVRRMYSDYDGKLVGIGGVLNFKEVYNYWTNIHTEIK